MLILAGIDYSMSCPCTCVHAGDLWSIQNCNFMFITKENRYQSVFLDEKITGKEPTEFLNDTERFAGLARLTIDFLEEMCCENVLIEGYAMGAKGRVFAIGENTGILKHMLLNDLVDFDVIAPTVIKKFATGKGNADKDLMYKTFLDETAIDLRKELNYNCKNISSPIGDIVDSYYICKYLFNQTKEK